MLRARGLMCSLRSVCGKGMSQRKSCSRMCQCDLCVGGENWGIMACSESLESEEFEDLGGEGPGIRRATRS